MQIFIKLLILGMFMIITGKFDKNCKRLPKFFSYFLSNF